MSAKPGKRKNGVCSFSRPVGRLALGKIRAVDCALDRDHALQDVGARLRLAHVAQRRLRVGVGVVGDGVAFGELAPSQRRQRVDLAADDEEGGAHALVGEGARICGVVSSSGPSSKVRITSWSASAIVLG